MSQGPLFSTYRQGENRVTASMIAVFERIDLALLERLLGAASGESALQMISFRNQVTGTGSVPDAGIFAHLNYLFEVKTERDAVNARQLRAHLDSLGDAGDQRLFVVTPDRDEPDTVAVLRNEDARVSWIGFTGLTEAIDGALSSSDIMVSGREVFLLRELVRLFEEDGLLTSPEDVVIVAAGVAYDLYRRHHLYICQAGRTFRRDIRRIGFYTAKAIQQEIPVILYRRDAVDLSQESAEALMKSAKPVERDAGKALASAIDIGSVEIGGQGQVFLLSAPGDERTLTLPQPIVHAEPSAWTQRQRYIASEVLGEGPTSTSELG